MKDTSTADRYRRDLLRTVVLAMSLIVAGCAVSPDRADFPSRAPAPVPPVDPNGIADAVPRAEPLSKRGNMPVYEVFGKRYYTLTSAVGYHEQGIASWYGPTFHGKLTSSGEVYDMHAMTAAHKTLPLPSYVQVTNLSNGRSAIVRVNDRGPFHDGRIIDLSYAAATKLGVVGPGTAQVEVRAITPDNNAVAVPVAVSARAVSADPQRRVYLQVGAFGSRNNAEQMRARLGDIPAPVSISEDHADHGLLYRVRVGPLARLNDVQPLTGKINALGIDAYVVVE